MKRWTLFRFLFFCLLAADVIDLGAFSYTTRDCEFKLTHIPHLHHFIPTWLINGNAYSNMAGIISGLCVYAMFDTGSKNCITFIATLYSWMYLSSMTDLYQHHYLLALVLFILSDPDEKRSVQMIRYEMALVYFFTMMAKLTDPPFLSGELLALHLVTKTNFLYFLLSKTIGTNWVMISWMTILLEFFLFCAFLFIRDDTHSAIRTIVSILGISFHFALTLATYHMRSFSFYMILFYVLTVVPNYVFTHG